MTVRDTCTMMEERLTPNLTELFKQKGDACLAAPLQGYHDIYTLLGSRMFMAVWTFTVPAKQCFVLNFFIRIWNRQSTSYSNKLTILNGGSALPVMMESGIFRYEHLLQNNQTTVSVVYFYASMNQRVYWRMAPSLRTSDCVC